MVAVILLNHQTCQHKYEKQVQWKTTI